jgi:Family of unknown function (DUF5518)
MNPAKLQAALLGGIAIGVLSALPIVNVVNLCCCAWVVFGGALAAYLMQQNHPAPVSAGDGAIVGLMAGAIGALVFTVLAIPISLALGPFQQQLLERMIESARDMPPELRGMIEQMRDSIGGGAVLGIGFFISLMIYLCMYSVFGLVGGLIGAVMFRKNTPPPPPPPPPSSGFEPPSFTPPPPFPPAPPPTV